MWAQNFARSQVTYEIPVEVLTASSPIALSPFADGGFGAEGGSEHCHQISNYNLAAPFNPNVSHRIRGGKDDSDVIDGADPATVKAAEADAAEASLAHRYHAVGMYFDPNRPRQNNLKTLGPHHHHHTLVNKKVKGSESGDDLTVLVRGDNVFGTTASKSFAGEGGGNQDSINGVVTASVSIASYRVVESKKHGKYAQFLVIYCEGTFRETIGVWKRYSDFSALACKVTHGHEKCSSLLTGINPLAITEDTEFEMLPNATTSWRLLKMRQRWYRCLDAGYLSLKVFLLERFLHDILFESSSPYILRDFVGPAQTQKIS
uniref:PX domain-containing protein n=1 Tax=Helicotheca tamesis TaxID=374047 RepID=A0A7S2H8P9_9STRA